MTSATDRAFLREPPRLPARPRLMVDAAIGALMATARRRRGLTCREVGEAIGVCAISIEHWERGRSRIPPERMEALAEALGVPAGDLARVDHIAVTERERAILAACRRLSDADQEAFLDLLSAPSHHQGRSDG